MANIGKNKDVDGEVAYTQTLASLVMLSDGKHLEQKLGEQDSAIAQCNNNLTHYMPIPQYENVGGWTTKTSGKEVITISHDGNGYVSIVAYQKTASYNNLSINGKEVAIYSGTEYFYVGMFPVTKGDVVTCGAEMSATNKILVKYIPT